MINYKSNDGMLHSISWSEYINQSEYDKATIEYPVEKVVYKTTTEKKQDTVIDADGKEHILREYEVAVPVLDEEWNPVIESKEREIVRYNKYNSEWVVIIPDDATVLTEEQYKAELEKLKTK